jgi:hypothetical protein
MNKKYELLVIGGTRPKDMKTHYEKIISVTTCLFSCNVILLNNF